MAIPNLDRETASEILDLVHDAIIVRGVDGRVVQWNLAAEQQYGWSRPEALGRDLRELLRCSHPLPLPELEAELFDTGRWEGEFGRFDRAGREVLVDARWSLGRDADGRPSHIVETSRDVTERRKDEKTLRLNEYRYRNLFQAMAVAFWEIDFQPMRVMLGEAAAAGVTDIRAYMLENRGFVREAMRRAVVTDVNEKTVMLFGARSADQIVGGNVAPYWPPASEPVFVESVMASLDNRPHFITETKLLTLQGAEIDALFTVSWSPESRKKGIILLGVIDISDRIRAQAAVQRLQGDFAHAARISMLGELTTSIAHEVNQPLAAIATNAEAAIRWLGRAEPDIEEVRAISHRIVADARRAADIIQRIRGMAERRMPERSPVILESVLEEVLLFLRHELQRHGVEVTLSAAEIPPISADRTQIQQVFVNLALNAIHAMSDAQEAERRVSIRAEAIADDTVEVVFEDSGPGLTGEQRERAFETFFSTKPTGLGMGLPICRSILQAHGGTIVAEEPAVETGARFRVTLPLIS